MPSLLKRAELRLKKFTQKLDKKEKVVIVGVDLEQILIKRPEIGDHLAITISDLSHRTAEIAANAPRYRRKSSTFIDAIHDVPEDQSLAPAQLYSTMSGRLFHSGRIAIVMVGLPARGKT